MAFHLNFRFLLRPGQTAKRLAAFGLMLLALPACERDVKNIKLPEADPKLVLGAFISPQDTVLAVRVDKTRPVVGKFRLDTQQPIRNATVILSDGARSITLSYSNETGTYQAWPHELPIRAGKTYFLEVSTPDGLRASASCTVPETAEVAFREVNASRTTRTQPGGYSYREYTYSVRWQDAHGRANFYRITGSLDVYYRPPYNESPAKMLLWANEAQSMISDEGNDGRVLTLSNLPLFVESLDFGSGGGYVDYMRIQATINVTDRHYYLYHKSVYDQYMAEGNPFAEPVFVYSNVEGGLGVFCAYNQLTFEKLYFPEN
jgi:hypothetical protein